MRVLQGKPLRKLHDCYLRNLSTREAAKIVPCAPGTVNRWYLSWGRPPEKIKEVDLRRRRERLYAERGEPPDRRLVVNRKVIDPELYDELRRLYIAGASAMEAARKTGVSKWTAHVQYLIWQALVP